VALQSVAYASNNDMAEMLRADSKTVGNAMQRLFNAGRISRADVHHRVGQQRPSFLLWAISSNDFVEGEE
jgi:predicted transcriptional regulator